MANRTAAGSTTPIPLTATGKPPHTLLVRGFDRLLTMDSSIGEGPLGELEQASVLVEAGRVRWVGTGPPPTATPVDEVIDAHGWVGMPALIDCHTHAIWAGSRAEEWRERLAGVSYAEVLERGGGILSTVAATRAASGEELVSACVARLHRMRAKGVGTVEIKSGYGLSVAHELRLLRSARRAGDATGMKVLTTFLGAHTIPAEHRANRDVYVDEVVHEQLAAVVGLADFVDAYVDRGAFTVAEGRRILSAGKAQGLKVKIHAEQVSYTGAAAMAASLGATSADHLEQLDEDGVRALAAAGTVAVLLPGAMLYLRDAPPPVAALRAAGVPLAVATDLNPGSSPVDDLWACATLACLAMGLTVEEALLGITKNAARALDLPDRGQLRPGAVASLIGVRRDGEPASAAALLQHLGAPEVRWFADA